MTTPTPANDPNTEFDSPWKQLLETYFEAFIAFFFPQARDRIDWTRPVEFLDKELQKVVRDAELSKRLADKLVKVYLADGSTAWVLIHIEIQSQVESDFAERMFQYHYRIRDRYSQKVASFAILGDDRPSWRPHELDDELFGCRVKFVFPIVKLLDYQTRWQDLERSTNPFAIMVMAHLKALETRNDRLERQQWKLILTRRLYELGYNSQDVINLFYFIDWLMSLPEDLDREFWQQVRQIEEEKQMRYVTSVERRAIEQGIEQGIDREVSFVVRLLDRRFGKLDETLVERVRRLPIDRVEELGENLFDFETEADVQNWLDRLED